MNINNIEDPRLIPQSYCPTFISKSSTTDFESFLIQWDTAGCWNHSMLMRTQEKVVWQGLQIVEKPIDLYMNKGTRLDFFTLKDINPSAISAMNNYINKRMAGHWWTQTYDFVGIVGQAIHVPAIHTPGIDYCSVFELAVLRSMCPFLSKQSSDVIMAQKLESNPQDLHDMYVKNINVFIPYASYEADEGIVV